MKRLMPCVVGALILAAFAQPAAALDADLVIPLDVVIANGRVEGSRVELAEASSGPFAGETCTVRAVHRGEGAPHSGSDLIVISGSETATLHDVERAPGAVTDAADPLLLADVIHVELEMGVDSAFEGDIDVEFECSPPFAEQGLEADPASGDPANLPITGSETRVGILLAVGLISSGTALLALARRRAPPLDLHSR